MGRLKVVGVIRTASGFGVIWSTWIADQSGGSASPQIHAQTALALNQGGQVLAVSGPEVGLCVVGVVDG